MPTTDCECREPGWCERHACQKSVHWHRLCRQGNEYFALWEAGEGPGQRPLPHDPQAETAPTYQITVLMVTYNRRAYTERALETLWKSSVADSEFVVWDNGSSDGTRDWLCNVVAGRPNWTLILSDHNVGVVRPMNVVWSTARTPLVAKIDNDTLVPTDFVSSLSRRLLDADAESLGVLSGCHFRPEDVAEQIPQNGPADRALWRQSHVGGCAVMMRRELFQRFGPIACNQNSQEGPFLESGWTRYQERLHRAGYANGYPLPLIYVEHMEDTRSHFYIGDKQHEDYKQAMRGLSLDECTEQYYKPGPRQRVRKCRSAPRGSSDTSDLEIQGIEQPPVVTLFVPLAGRANVWSRLRTFLENQTWPRKQTQLLLLDTAHNRQFSETVRSWLATSDYMDVRYLFQQVGAEGLAERPRREAQREVRQAVAAIYNRLVQELTTEFVWILEDDILPPLNVCSRLMWGFDEQTVSVAAPYRSRFGDRYVAWDENGRNYREPNAGLQHVGGNGLGCALIRGELFRRQYFSEDEDCDREFYQTTQAAGLTVKLDWSCLCEHWDEIGTTEVIRPQFRLEGA